MAAITTPTDSCIAVAPTHFLRALTAPLRLLHPRQVAQALSRARTGVFIATYLVYSCLLAAALTVAFLLDEMVTSSGALNATEVWQRWHDGSVIGLPEWTLLIILLCVPLLNGFLAWLFLPSIHKNGSAAKPFELAFRAASSGMALVVMLTFSVGIAAVSIKNSRDAGSTTGGEFGGLVISAILASIALLVFWLAQAVKGVAPTNEPVHFPPRCEGCGYDLTHTAEQGRCTECGMAIAESLGAARRPGCAWEKSRSAAAWGQAVREAVCRPTGFYGRMRLRKGVESAEALAQWNLLVIGLAAAAWSLVLEVNDSPGVRREMLIVPIVASLVVTMVAWCLLRIVGAFVISFWIVKQSVLDVRWARKVLAYESAWLWTFCAYSGLMITSFVAFGGNWMTDVQDAMLGHRYRFLGMQLEPLALLLGNAVLCLIWLLRYRIILRAIRWSNY